MRAVALLPSLAVVVTLQVVQRWMNFAIANPARQVFFTVVAREEKYKAKNLIDVVVYRGSDALYGWAYDALQGLGLKLGRHRALRVAGGRGMVHSVDRARAVAGAARDAASRSRARRVA